MPFGSIVATNASSVSATYNETQNGVYYDSTTQFGVYPQRYIKVSPGKSSGPNAPINFSVTRITEFAPDAQGKIPRLSVSLNVSVPRVATSVHVDNASAEISSWLTTAILDAILLGRY